MREEDLSASAAASMSSSSEASSTIPPQSLRALTALLMLTGSPIWMAEAKVVSACMGSKTSQLLLYILYRGLAFLAWATTILGIRSVRPRSMHILKPL